MRIRRIVGTGAAVLGLTIVGRRPCIWWRSGNIDVREQWFPKGVPPDVARVLPELDR